jgi:hypothetical protein
MREILNVDLPRAIEKAAASLEQSGNKHLANKLRDKWPFIDYQLTEELYHLEPPDYITVFVQSGDEKYFEWYIVYSMLSSLEEHIEPVSGSLEQDIAQANAITNWCIHWRATNTIYQWIAIFGCRTLSPDQKKKMVRA